MNEFVTVSSSSYDPATLATKLNEKAAEGWSVVAIVPTGGDVTAFLSRPVGDAAPAMAEATPMTAEAAPAMMAEVAPAAEPMAMMAETTPEPAAEPAGWAVAPDSPSTSSAPATVIQTSSPGGGISTYGQTAQPAAQSYQPAAAAATPSVPAGWYADPAGRFDLRYWDGSTWTEHVSRAGQQYTDAPVA